MDVKLKKHFFPILFVVGLVAVHWIIGNQLVRAPYTRVKTLRSTILS